MIGFEIGTKYFAPAHPYPELDQSAGASLEDVQIFGVVVGVEDRDERRQWRHRKRDDGDEASLVHLSLDLDEGQPQEGHAQVPGRRVDDGEQSHLKLATKVG